MSDDGTALLRQFCSLLTGKHSNQQQAFDNPPFFAHIILNYRALPQFSAPTMLLEQGYAIPTLLTAFVFFKQPFAASVPFA